MAVRSSVTINAPRVGPIITLFLEAWNLI